MTETGAVSVVVMLAALETERLRKLREAARSVAEQMAKIEARLVKTREVA